MVHVTPPARPDTLTPVSAKMRMIAPSRRDPKSWRMQARGRAVISASVKKGSPPREPRVLHPDHVLGRHLADVVRHIMIKKKLRQRPGGGVGLDSPGALLAT
jgi:hypothetical protein